jgi:hypothetical protein
MLSLTRPEARLLLHCARTTLDEERAGVVRTLVREDLDWLLVHQLASRHRVGPLVYHHLSTLDGVPREALAPLRVEVLRGVRRNLLLVRELGRVLDAFGAEKVACVVYKGPVLAESLYGDLALRPFDDLDLLVPREGVARARRALLALGYESEHTFRHIQERVHFMTQCELNFRHADSGALVEVHWQFVPPYYGFGLDFAEVRDRLRVCAVAGREALTLSPEDLLLVLCVHGSKHFWGYLGLLVDVAEAVRARDELNWSQLLERAEQQHARRALLLGLALAADVLDAGLPEAVSGEIAADRAIPALIAYVEQRLASERRYPSGAEMVASRRFQLQSKDSGWDRLRMMSLAAGSGVLRAVKLANPVN